MSVHKDIIFGGVLTTYILRERGSEGLLDSHFPIFSLNPPDSFWFNENKSSYNLTDVHDNSYINLCFPVGLASHSTGLYGSSLMSVVLNKINEQEESITDFDSPHQNFVLLLLRNNLIINLSLII